MGENYLLHPSIMAFAFQSAVKPTKEDSMLIGKSFNVNIRDVQRVLVILPPSYFVWQLRFWHRNLEM